MPVVFAMLALLLIASKWVALLGMIAAGVMGYTYGGVIRPQTHYLTGMIFSFLFSLAQVMTVYYFVGMRRALADAHQKYGLEGDIPQKALDLKKRVSGPGYLLAVLATLALISAGGALFDKIPIWIHIWVSGATIALGIRAGIVEYKAFRTNAELFARTADRIAALPPEVPVQYVMPHGKR